MLRRVFGPKGDEVTGEWRKIHNEGLCDLYSSPNIIRAIKSRRIRWAGRVVRTGESIGAYRVCVRRFERKKPLGRPGINGRIILNRIFRKWNGES